MSLHWVYGAHEDRRQPIESHHAREAEKAHHAREAENPRQIQGRFSRFTWSACLNVEPYDLVWGRMMGCKAEKYCEILCVLKFARSCVSPDFMARVEVCSIHCAPVYVNKGVNLSASVRVCACVSDVFQIDTLAVHVCVSWSVCVRACVRECVRARVRACAMIFKRRHPL